LKNAPSGTGRIDSVLSGVELNFVLEAGELSVLIDHQSCDQESVIDQTFGAENNREICFRGCSCNDGPRAFEDAASGGWHHLPQAAVAGNEAFGKANQPGPLNGCLSDGLFCQRDRLFWSSREPEVC
jgi:hypothetical protein